MKIYIRVIQMRYIINNLNQKALTKLILNKNKDGIKNLLESILLSIT